MRMTSTLCHQRLQIPVRGRNDSAGNRLWGHAADAYQLAFLQNPQQLSLHLQRHLADFIQEDRTSIGQLKLAGLAFACSTREGSRRIAKELRFQ
jgi:hypothetical protein